MVSASPLTTTTPLTLDTLTSETTSSTSTPLQPSKTSEYFDLGGGQKIRAKLASNIATTNVIVQEGFAGIPEIVIKIGEFLQEAKDLHAMRVVCKQWMAAADVVLSRIIVNNSKEIIDPSTPRTIVRKPATKAKHSALPAKNEHKIHISKEQRKLFNANEMAFIRDESISAIFRQEFVTQRIAEGSKKPTEQSVAAHKQPISPLQKAKEKEKSLSKYGTLGNSSLKKQLKTLFKFAHFLNIPSPPTSQRCSDEDQQTVPRTPSGNMLTI